MRVEALVIGGVLYAGAKTVQQLQARGGPSWPGRWSVLRRDTMFGTLLVLVLVVLQVFVMVELLRRIVARRRAILAVRLRPMDRRGCAAPWGWISRRPNFFSPG